MNDTLEDELRSMYHNRSTHLRTHGPGLENEPAVRVVANRPPAHRGRRLVLATAASVAVLGGLGGLWVINDRPSEPTAADVPPVATVAPLATPGRWTMDTPPDGLHLTDVSDQRPAAGSDQSFTRIYASTSTTPELDPLVVLTSYPATMGSPVFAGATTFDVGGSSGMQWAAAGREVIAFSRDGYWYILETSGVTDLVALAATAQRAPDGFGAVIDATLLPTGVHEAGVGIIEEVRFLSTDALAGAIRSAHWESSTNSAGVFYQSIVESPEQFRLHRIEHAYSSITDITVNGHAATQLVGHDMGDFVTITWNDGQRTMIVTGYNVDAAVAVSAATALRPASDAEWQAMQAAALRALDDSPTATTTEIADTTTTVTARPAPEHGTSGGRAGLARPTP